MLNLRYHSERVALPIWLVLVHAVAAALGLVVLAIAGWNVGAG